MKVSEAIKILESKVVKSEENLKHFPKESQGYAANEARIIAYNIAINKLEQIDEPQGEKVEAHLAEHWNEDIGNVLWWNFPVEEPPYCGTPLDEHFPKYKTHFTTIDMPNEIEKPKRWVVKFKVEEADFYFMGWSDIYKTVDNPFVPNGYKEKDKDCVFKFDDKAKAEAVATLVEGSVEEV